jgi:hypothetical protein
MMLGTTNIKLSSLVSMLVEKEFVFLWLWTQKLVRIFPSGRNEVVSNADYIDLQFFFLNIGRLDFEIPRGVPSSFVPQSLGHEFFKTDCNAFMKIGPTDNLWLWNPAHMHMATWTSV